jgi:hypothetical protein
LARDSLQRVRPGNERPSASRSSLIGIKNYAGDCNIITVGRSRVIQNPNRQNVWRQVIFIRSLRTNQIAGFAGRERISNVIELIEGKIVAGFGNLSLFTVLRLRGLSARWPNLKQYQKNASERYGKEGAAERSQAR